MTLLGLVAYLSPNAPMRLFSHSEFFCAAVDGGRAWSISRPRLSGCSTGAFALSAGKCRISHAVIGIF